MLDVSDLVCPLCRSALRSEGDGSLHCAEGHVWPVYGGIPVFILRDTEPTHPRAMGESANPELAALALRLDGGAPLPPDHILPYVRGKLRGTCGNAYGAVADRFGYYPIPDLRLPPAREGESLLDIGCHWGRWSIAAAQKGYIVTGIDPSFQALVAARIVCRQLGVTARFICADARCMPFRDKSIDVSFSYSVIQHFSKTDARTAFGEIARVTRKISMIQMPNKFGLRCIYHQIRGSSRPDDPFAVRYWTPRELHETCKQIIGPTRLSIDGFFGLGIQAKHAHEFLPSHRFFVRLSERLRQCHFPLFAADSLYAHSVPHEE